MDTPDIVEVGRGHKGGINDSGNDELLQSDLGRGKAEDAKIDGDATTIDQVGTETCQQDDNIQDNIRTFENKNLESEAIAGPSSLPRVQSVDLVASNSLDVEDENQESNHSTTSAVTGQPSPLEGQKTSHTPTQPPSSDQVIEGSLHVEDENQESNHSRTSAGTGQSSHLKGKKTTSIPSQSQPQSSDQQGRATTSTAKYKRLLSMAKRSIEENLRQINDKNAVIAALNEELELAGRQGGIRYGKMGPKAGGSSPPSVPIQAVLRKVSSPGYVWVLLELADEEGSLEWRGFQSEYELVTFVIENASAWGGAEGIAIPVTCLTPQETMELQAKSEAKLKEIRENYRRYRVQAELRQKHKDAEVRMIAANAISTKQKRLGNQWEGERGEIPENHNNIPDSARRRGATTHGVGGGGLETGRTSLESKLSKRVKELEAELKQQAEVWHMVHGKSSREVIAHRREGNETEIAIQWRKRYESAIRDKENALAKLDMLSNSGGEGGICGSGSAQGSVKDLDKKYNALKEEYRLYRKKAMEALNSRDGGTKTGGGGINLGGDINIESKLPYAKQVFMQYLTTDDQTRKKTLERVLMTVLEFSTNEQDNVHETRESSLNAWIPDLFGMSSSGSTAAS